MNIAQKEVTDLTEDMEADYADRLEQNLVNLDQLAESWEVDLDRVEELVSQLLDLGRLGGELSEWPDENGNTWLQLSEDEVYSDFIKELGSLLNASA